MLDIRSLTLTKVVRVHNPNRVAEAIDKAWRKGRALRIRALEEATAEVVPRLDAKASLIGKAVNRAWIIGQAERLRKRSPS